MLHWFKKYFIPHEGNDHRPHLLHKRSIKNIILGLVFVELVIFALPTLSLLKFDGSSMVGAVLPAVLDDLTNQNRQSAQLPDLKENSLLDKAAQMKADDMASQGYFAHNSPEGKTPWYWLNEVGYDYDYAGENLAVNFNDSKDVSSAWMNSPTHRANVLKPVYKEVGTGLATGVYKGHDAVFVVQLYGTPKASLKETIKEVSGIESQKEDKSEASIAEFVVAEGDPTINNEEKVLGASVTDVSPTVVSKVLSSPHQNTNTVLFITSTIVLLVLLLKVLIKSKIKHPDLIINGLLVVVIIMVLYIANNYISTRNAEITSSKALSPVSIIDTKTKIS